MSYGSGCAAWEKSKASRFLGGGAVSPDVGEGTIPRSVRIAAGQEGCNNHLGDAV